MKFITLLAFTCALSLSTPLSSKADMTVQLDLVSANENMKASLKFGSGNVRAESDKGSAILFPAEHKIIMLMPADKKYMILPMKPKGQVPQANGPAEVPEIVNTGKKEVISGYDCEQVLIKTAKGPTSELWVSSKAPKIEELMKPLMAFQDQAPDSKVLMMMNLIGKNPALSTLPIRIIMHSPEGAEMGSVTVTSIKQDKIPATDFMPPQDYTEFKMMDAIMQMQQQMQQNGGKPTPEQMQQIQRMMEQMKPGQ